MWRGMRGSVQWRLLWWWNAKFMVGVSGVVRDPEGRVLLLRHRLWPEGRQWGLPTGYAKRSETFEDTVAREVREETGLEVKVGRLIRLQSGFRLRMEVAYEAEFVRGEIRIDPLEILEARWVSPHDLPDGVMPGHRVLIEGG
ncbi:NUDIX hydrolase [Microtetraspora sp. NBRC 13810]|nr:NUDIX hydrolase [Microtetraspora sp. NBRC 13810]